MCFVVLCPGAPEGPTDSGSGLKGLRGRGHGLKSHPTDGESRESNSGLLGTRRVTYPLHLGGSLFLLFLLLTLVLLLTLLSQRLIGTQNYLIS